MYTHMHTHNYVENHTLHILPGNHFGLFGYFFNCCHLCHFYCSPSYITFIYLICCMFVFERDNNYRISLCISNLLTYFNFRHAYGIQIKEVNQLLTKAVISLPLKLESSQENVDYLKQLTSVSCFFTVKYIFFKLLKRNWYNLGYCLFVFPEVTMGFNDFWWFISIYALYTFWVLIDWGNINWIVASYVLSL